MSGATLSNAATTSGVARRLMRSAALVCVAALGVLSCGTPLTPTGPDGRAAAMRGLKPVVVEAAADVNLRPIRLWFVEGAEGVKALYVVGHADGECCPEISGVLHDLASRPGIKNGWLSFGYGHFEAADAEGASTLAGIRATIEKKASEPVCKGQVAVTRALPSDVIHDDSAKLIGAAGGVFEKAKELGRPVLLSYRFNDSHPRIVPATVAGASGAVDLQFRIPISDLAPPRLVTRSFSLDGIAQVISAIRADLARLDIGSVDLTNQAALVDVTARTNYRAPQGIAEITDATRKIDALLERLRSTQSESANAGMVSVLEESKRMNDAALAEIMSLPDSPSMVIIIKFRNVKNRPNAAAAAERARLEGLLEKWEGRRSHASARTVHPALVDAFLRGWPAGFEDPAAEFEYAHWLTKRQKTVWKYVYDQLAARGIDTGEPDGPGILQRSNVVFDVRVDGRDMVVTPFFIVTGSTLQIADTAAGLVHYETSTADQNLASP